MLPTWQALADGARYVEPRLKEIWDELRPTSSSRTTSSTSPPSRPATSRGSASCRATRWRFPTRRCPPPYSGLGMADTEAWADFRAEYERTHAALHGEFDAWVRGAGRRRTARARVDRDLARREPVPLSRGGGLPALAVAGRHLAPARLVRARSRRRRGSRRTGTARSSTSRSGRSAPPTSSSWNVSSRSSPTRRTATSSLWARSTSCSRSRPTWWGPRSSPRPRSSPTSTS